MAATRAPEYLGAHDRDSAERNRVRQLPYAHPSLRRKGEAREFAEVALAKGMPRLGFSGHNPVPFPASWTMPPAIWKATCGKSGRPRRP